MKRKEATHNLGQDQLNALELLSIALGPVSVLSVSKPDSVKWDEESALLGHRSGSFLTLDALEDQV